MQPIKDLSEIIMDFGVPDKRRVADIVDKPLTILEISMHRSDFDTRRDKRYAIIVAALDEGQGVHLVRVNADQPYLLNKLDKAKCSLTGTSDIGNLWWLNIPFTCKITMLGKFYTLEGVRNVCTKAEA